MSKVVINNRYRYLDVRVRRYQVFLTTSKILLTTQPAPTEAVRRYAFYTPIYERVEFISFFLSWKVRRASFVPDESSIGHSLFKFARVFN